MKILEKFEEAKNRSHSFWGSFKTVKASDIKDLQSYKAEDKILTWLSACNTLRNSWGLKCFNREHTNTQKRIILSNLSKSAFNILKRFEGAKPEVYEVLKETSDFLDCFIKYN